MAAVTRRRGAALEEALLAAAWDELVEKGYAGFTIDGVADRAHTGRQVLYRRWPAKRELALAAVARYHSHNIVSVPDTGSLRGDLIAYLTEALAKRAEMAALLTLNMAQVFAEGGGTPSQLREELLGINARALGTRPVDQIFDRAVARGEADPARLTARVRALPFDLLRSQMMMTMGAVPADEIPGIVDEIVLPLVQPGRPAP
jgi:AcrR family transcriptional regulator